MSDNPVENILVYPRFGVFVIDTDTHNVEFKGTILIEMRHKLLAHLVEGSSSFELNGKKHFRAQGKYIDEVYAHFVSEATYFILCDIFTNEQRQNVPELPIQLSQGFSLSSMNDNDIPAYFKVRGGKTDVMDIKATCYGFNPQKRLKEIFDAEMEKQSKKVGCEIESVGEAIKGNMAAFNAGTYDTSTPIAVKFTDDRPNFFEGLYRSQEDLDKDTRIAQIEHLARRDGTSSMFRDKGFLQEMKAKWYSAPEDMAKKQAKKKKEDNMFNFDFQFGECTDERIKSSFYGVAVEKNGKYIAYANGDAIDVTGFTFDDKMGKLFMLPTGMDYIDEGDIIMHNGTPVSVCTVNKKTITVVDIGGAEMREILPIKNPLGYNFFTKVFSPFSGMMGQASDENPFGNPMALAMMMNNSGSSGGMDTMMMMCAMQSMNGGANFLGQLAPQKKKRKRNTESKPKEEESKEQEKDDDQADF